MGNLLHVTAATKRIPRLHAQIPHPFLLRVFPHTEHHEAHFSLSEWSEHVAQRKTRKRLFLGLPTAQE